MVYREFQRAPSPARLEKKKAPHFKKNLWPSANHSNSGVRMGIGEGGAEHFTSHPRRGASWWAARPEGSATSKTSETPQYGPWGKARLRSHLLSGSAFRWLETRAITMNLLTVSRIEKKKKKRNGKTQPAWWFNGIPGRSPLQALPHSWVQRSLRVLWSSLQKI